MNKCTTQIILVTLGLFFLLAMTSSTPVLGHGGEDQAVDEPISLNLETILFLTIFTGVILLAILSKLIGIDDNRFLIKIAVTSLVLLVLDYTYIRFLR